MNGHFSVINKKGMAITFVIMAVNAGISGMSLAMIISGGSKLWLLPIIFFVTFFLIATLIMIQIVNAGIDIKRGIVIMPDIDPKKGKCPQFNLQQLSEIYLADKDGNHVNPDTASLSGARVTFKLEDGSIKQYYPIAITKKQFKSIEKGMMTLLNELKNDALFND